VDHGDVTGERGDEGSIGPPCRRRHPGSTVEDPNCPIARLFCLPLFTNVGEEVFSEVGADPYLLLLGFRSGIGGPGPRAHRAYFVSAVRHCSAEQFRIRSKRLAKPSRRAGSAVWWRLRSW
jgi:hypothetical protein